MAVNGKNLPSAAVLAANGGVLWSLPMHLERQRLSARAGDGLRLNLERVHAPERQARGAVMMQHGLASNGHCFLVTGRSLAEHLAEQGYDCYVTELRGAGGSERPASPWSIDDYLDLDLPPLIATVLESSGRSRLSYIGHSLGGVLMMMYGIEHPEAPLDRLVTVASSLDYANSRNMYHRLNRLRPLAGRWLRYVPFGLLAKANAPLAGLGPAFPPEAMNFQRANTARAVSRELLSRGFETIPLPVLDGLRTTFAPGGFQRASGRVRYLERAATLRVPTLLLAGTRDPHCAPQAVEQTAELLSGCAEREVRVFGRRHGHVENYGHFDLLSGLRAPSEVWPTISAFLGRPMSYNSFIDGPSHPEGADHARPHEVA